MSSTVEYGWTIRERDKYYTLYFVRKRVLKSFGEDRYPPPKKQKTKKPITPLKVQLFRKKLLLGVFALTCQDFFHQIFVNLDGFRTLPTKSWWDNFWSFLVTAFTSKLNTLYRMTRSELIGNGWNGRRWRNAMCGSPRLVCCQPPDMTCHILPPSSPTFVKICCQSTFNICPTRLLRSWVALSSDREHKSRNAY